MISVLAPSQLAMSAGGFFITPVIILFVLGFIAKLLVEVLRDNRISSNTHLPYRAIPSLLTKAERSFYEVLQRATPPGYCVFSKVRIADLVEVPRGTRNWYTHFNRITSKHVDFIICDTGLIRPRLAIELDDSSHSKPSRQNRDTFVDQALAAAGLPILHVTASVNYAPSRIRDMITAALPAKAGHASAAVAV